MSGAATPWRASGPRLRRHLPPAYTRGMRRILVLLAVIARLASQTYVWTAKPLPRPAPIERPLSERESATREPWWLP